jgi:LysM repeat protein
MPIISEETTKSTATLTEKVEYSVVKENDIVHIIRKGETLSGVASKYHSTAQAIMSANRMSVARVMVGQHLRIPAKTEVGSQRGQASYSVSGRTVVSKSPVVAAAAPAVTFQRYSVRRGDTVGTVASRFGISVAQLKATNHLGSNRIVVGQALKIPMRTRQSSTKVVATQYYNVKRGDSLWSIAKRHGVSQQQILRMNGTTIKSLRVGQKIRVR